MRYEVAEPPISEFAPGIRLSEIAAGGRDGPHGEVRWPTRGGQVWLSSWVLGTEDDAFQLTIPDVRMPANQYWPLHWHDCWIAMIVLDGECQVGDRWFETGDVLVAPAGVEYGPLVCGPTGCQVFEIFAQSHLSLGGYGPEYHDHPTLQDTAPDGGTMFAFLPRAAENKRNADRETLPLASEPRITLGRLGTGGSWNLGEDGDPERGVVWDTRLGALETVPQRTARDWRAIFVLDGTVDVNGRELGPRMILLVEPGAQIPEFRAGEGGAQLLEVSRTVDEQTD